MTALCGGGTSGPKPGQEAELIYSSGLLVQVLEGLSLEWLAPLIPLVPLAPFVLTVFCMSDPPAFTNLTADEANALLQLDYSNANFGTGVAKLPNIFANAIWNYSCQCTSGAYTPPAPTQPAGTAVIVQPVGGTNAPCVTYADDLGGSIGPGTSNVAIFLIDKPAPASPQTAASVDAFFTNTPGPTPAITWTWTWVNSPNPNINKTTTSAGGVAEYHATMSNPQVGYTLSDVGINCSGGGVVGFHADLDIWCNGTIPNGQQQPCCPPDSATQGYLDNILKMVTLIQRQQVPFAYILGTVHSGLTGSGELSLQGLLGAKLTPGTPPPYSGVQVGDPNELWLESWINWGNADGWSERIWLRHSPQISIPPFGGQWTKLGYTLAPGLSVDVQELKREP